MQTNRILSPSTITAEGFFIVPKGTKRVHKTTYMLLFSCPLSLFLAFYRKFFAFFLRERNNLRNFAIAKLIKRNSFLRRLTQSAFKILFFKLHPQYNETINVTILAVVLR